ncbi:MULTISPECIES: IclR family transcriptional regulator [unclassified Microbacterium]|uniref:IclR family transcriptional regulator n=1 Tax=unclassified Microbacterium TaxID=2609290 RepID=UPI003016F216
MADRAPDAAKPSSGSRTFARGLRAFLAVVESHEGTSVQEIADLLGVHRSIAYRLLQTLMDVGLVTRGSGGAYLPGPRLATLSQAYLPILRDAAAPIMQELADRVASTILLFVEQSDHAVAVSMAEPRTATHHIAFRPGMRTPLDRGAAASALLAARPPHEGEDSAVAAIRARGYARSHGAVLDGVYGVAAWIPLSESGLVACLNLITYIEPIADAAGPLMREAADRIHASMPRVRARTAR